MPASGTANSARSPQGLASFGCENCRGAHLKCDRVTPTCGRCSASGRECQRTGLKIRAVKKNFSKKQKWVKTPKQLEWTVTNDGTYQDNGADDGDADVSLDSPCASEDSCSRGGPLSSAGAAPSPTILIGPRGSPTDRFIQRDQRERDFLISTDKDPVACPALTTTHHNLHGRIQHPYLPESLLPLRGETEAWLFRHFVQKLASWLDLCDRDKSFETIIPQRASTCEVLMKAILALASMHLVHTTRQVKLVDVERHRDACTDCLHPLLREKRVFNGDIFAACIIMRVWEEINVLNEGKDHEGYILSIAHFVGIADNIEPGSLSAASFWVGLRQEIYVAVIKKEVVRMPLVQSLIDSLGRLTDAADDFTWANRAVVHCAKVLNFCYDQTNDRPASKWQELDTQSKQWEQYCPASYTEIYHQGAGPAFPEIWYHQSCHVIAWQHHILAKLYLARCDPRLPDQGTLTAAIQPLVRKICGIGLGNQWTPPSMFTACMAIAAFGDWFKDHRDREAMIYILDTTEKDHARPTRTVRRKLETLDTQSL